MAPRSRGGGARAAPTPPTPHQRGIHKLKRLLEDEDESPFTADHYMNFYT